MLGELRREMRAAADPARAAALQGFFQTGKGQYGEGDVFLGLTVPALRKLAAKYAAMPPGQLEALLAGVHEERSLALMILVRRFRKGGPAERDSICRFYLDHLRCVDNWDLVDGSAPYILGAWLEGREKKILRTLARSPRLWDRRVAMLATFHDIRRGCPGEALRIAAMLLDDTHDLIHKAVGWMLREVGKRCGMEAEEGFLQRHATRMPRTMLRYAVERFPEEKRRHFLGRR